MSSPQSLVSSRELLSLTASGINGTMVVGENDHGAGARPTRGSSSGNHRFMDRCGGTAPHAAGFEDQDGDEGGLVAIPVL